MKKSVFVYKAGILELAIHTEMSVYDEEKSEKENRPKSLNISFSELTLVGTVIIGFSIFVSFRRLTRDYPSERN
jgi:hypothetical protein